MSFELTIEDIPHYGYKDYELWVGDWELIRGIPLFSFALAVVRPDIMVICDPIEGDYPVKPSALILEILSPASIFKDRDIKFKLYQFYGVRYYLIANIDQQDIEYYVLKDNRYQQAGNLQEYQFLQDGTIKVSFSNIF